MIYPSSFAQRVGFDAVCDDISLHIQTEGGRELLDNIEFSSSYSTVALLNGQCAQMLGLLRSVEGYDLPKSGYVDIAILLSTVHIAGSFIEAGDLLRLSRAIILADDLTRFFSRLSLTGRYDLLAALGVDIDSHRELADHIDRIVDRFGNVRDGASPELASIRRRLVDKTAQISRRLQQILQHAQADGYADPDSSVSIRDGRAVIPVAAGHKRKIKGFVFDESASGRTAYIEPLEVIELNNEVRELQGAERYEIVRILSAVSDLVRPVLGDLLSAGRYICYLDFVLAKSRYAELICGALPIMCAEPIIDLRRARHPLLEKVFRAEGRADTLIPLDIRLTQQKPVLLISGPNAGGKSVCLKSVGLLQYMFQCGVLPPVAENSQMGIFDSIFIDIGDQQSIDNDLSTYSSHLLNMKVMLGQATCESLILIDEFGSGTEPNVGGAIAESILTQFIERRSRAVITTHYANLKYFAALHDGVENGAMMFDSQAIRPLYRLEMGVAGNSYAFEIARKIGLPESVLVGAAAIVGEDKMSLEKQLRDALRDKRYWEGKRDKIRITSNNVDRVAAEYESELAEIRQQRSLLIKEAKVEAAKIVAEANSLIEGTIREIKESSAQRERTIVARKRVEEFRREVTTDHIEDQGIEQKIALLREREKRRAQRSAERIKRSAESVAPPKPAVRAVEVGSTVRLDGGDVIGEVLSINGQKVTVAFGALGSTIDIGRLSVVSVGVVKSRHRPVTILGDNVTTAGAATLEAAIEFTTELDIRGMRGAEAFERVQQFVDRAIMLGQHRVRILHGKGTGALKEEVRRYLRSEPMVSSTRDEREELGGAGITVVEL